MKCDFDVLVVGGSHAGLSAAMALGRLLRTALVSDTGQARNRVSGHANNLISQDGVNPDQWRTNARRDLAKYETIQFLNSAVTSIVANDGAFKAEFAEGSAKTFRKVVLAYGVKDQLPEIPGLRELWGDSVFHCPFCHGFEFRGRKIGLLSNGKIAAHMIPMLRGLSDDVVVFTNGPAEELASPAFDRVLKFENKIERLEIENGHLKSVVLVGGERVACDGLLLGSTTPPQPSSTLADELGLKRTEFGTYEMLEMGLTRVAGVFVAGDIANPMHSVANAVANGQLAGARAAMEILSENLAAGI